MDTSIKDFEAAIAELRRTERPAADDGDGGGADPGGREDDSGSGGTVQVPEPAPAAD